MIAEYSPPPSHFEYSAADYFAKRQCERTCAQLENRASSTPFSPSPSDIFLFGEAWENVRALVASGEIFALIAERRLEIKNLKEHWRPFIEQKRNTNAFYSSFEKVLRRGKLNRIEEGIGAAYLLLDQRKSPRYVIKPVDEDILCLNNYKYFASPFNDSSIRVRENVPLYRSVQTDLIAVDVAALLGMPYITPETVMGVITSRIFYDITEALEITDSRELKHLCGSPDKEKLCSIQYFLRDSYELFDMLKIWQEKDLPLTKIASMIDQSDFEDANIFIWVIYDTDAHSGNMRLYVKKEAPGGHIVYGLRKIDNNLAFPEKNALLLNTLAYLPNADEKLSLRAKQIIATVPTEQIIEKMYFYEMPHCVEALKERVEVLRLLAQRDDLSIAAINLRMSLLEEPEGKELALSELSQEELENMILDSLSECAIPDE